jgi:hypothetical protein
MFEKIYDNIPSDKAHIESQQSLYSKLPSNIIKSIIKTEKIFIIGNLNKLIETACSTSCVIKRAADNNIFNGVMEKLFPSIK